MPEPGPYFTCMVEMADVPDFPFDYALYFSTDHHRGDGGIWLYMCNGSPSEPAHWKSYDQALADGDFDYLSDKPMANPIYVDMVQGRQTETPHVNIIERKAYMTYHNVGAGHNQSTLLATSPDGVNFKRIYGKADSVILDYDPKTAPGDGHTGYFRWGHNPFPEIDFRFVGYSLHGGTANYFSALWGSNDSVNWKKLAIISPIPGQGLDEERILTWTQIDPASIMPLGNDRFVAIAVAGSRSSGNSTRVAELYEVFLGPDGVTLPNKPRKVLARGGPNTDDNEEMTHPTSLRIGDQWYLVYVGVKELAKSNTLLITSVNFDRFATPSKTLSPDECRRHIMTGH